MKNDGVVITCKRIFKASLFLLKPVGSGNILFISGSGDSAMYRAYHVAEELEMHAFQCSVTIQDNPLLANYASKFDVFVFHRTVMTSTVSKLIRKIKQQHKEIIFETDDLLFDPKYLKQADYLKNISSLEKRAYENGLGAEILNDPYVRVCTTTTRFLADKLKEKGKQVFIVQNKLSNEDLKMAEEVLKNKKPHNSQQILLGYFSGTMSHNKDFATITDALVEVMKKYSQVKLFLAGPLNIENQLDKFSSRIIRSSFVSRKEHFENIAGVDINLAPLEIGDPFCEAKSEIKFSGAGILKVPTIATATQTFKEAITDGVDGFVVSTTNEWMIKLGKLIDDEKLRKEMGEKAYEKTMAQYTNKNSRNEEYYNFLRSKMRK